MPLWATQRPSMLRQSPVAAANPASCKSSAPPRRQRPLGTLLNLRAPKSTVAGEGGKGSCCPSGTWCSEAINHAGDSRVTVEGPHGSFALCLMATMTRQSLFEKPVWASTKALNLSQRLREDRLVSSSFGVPDPSPFLFLSCSFLFVLTPPARWPQHSKHTR